MKIFVIKSDDKTIREDLAYLFYYEKKKQFIIELPDDADYWETPMLLSAFVKRGEYTVDSKWSKIWVQQRIVPTDRQNLGQILKENKLKEYDEFELLVLGKGRCAQDDYYIEQITEEQIPASIKERANKRIEEVVPLDDFQLLVFFSNGKVKKCDVRKCFDKKEALSTFMVRSPSMFDYARIKVGGYGVYWEENMFISDVELYEIGEEIPLTMDDFKNFVSHRVINTAEASELLNCSRQNIDDLIRRDKLHPVKSTEKNKLFIKNEVEKRKWQ